MNRYKLEEIFLANIEDAIIKYAKFKGALVGSTNVERIENLGMLAIVKNYFNSYEVGFSFSSGHIPIGYIRKL